jgi:protein TonB
MPSLPMPAVVAALPPPPMETVAVQPAEQPKPQKTDGAARAAPAGACRTADGRANSGAGRSAVASITPRREPRIATAACRVAWRRGRRRRGRRRRGRRTAIGPGTGAPVRVGAKMQPPRKIKDVKPIYPDGALPSRSQGAVVIEATIGPDGKVKEVKVIHSVPALDQAAIDAVRQWEYTPSMLNGVAVSVIMTVVVNFAMQ